MVIINRQWEDQAIQQSEFLVKVPQKVSFFKPMKILQKDNISIKRNLKSTKDGKFLFLNSSVTLFYPFINSFKFTKLPVEDVICCDFSPCQTKIILVTSEGKAIIFKPDLDFTDHWVKECDLFQGEIRCSSWGNLFIALGDCSGNVVLVSYENNWRTMVKVSNVPVSNIEWLSDKKLLISINDGSAYICILSSPVEAISRSDFNSYSIHVEQVIDVDKRPVHFICSDGKSLAVLVKSFILILFDGESNREIDRFILPPCSICQIIWENDSLRIYTTDCRLFILPIMDKDQIFAFGNMMNDTATLRRNIEISKDDEGAEEEEDDETQNSNDILVYGAMASSHSILDILITR
jgi:hypothetical protein